MQAGKRGLLEWFSAYRYHSFIGTMLLDAGSYAGNTDHFAAFQLQQDIGVPAAAAYSENTYIYGPTMIGPDWKPLEIVSVYKRTWPFTNTERFIGVWNHILGRFDWSTWSDTSGFTNTYTTVDGGRRMIEVELYSTNGSQYALIWNYSTSSWNTMYGPTTGTRSTSLGNQGWVAFETYFPWGTSAYTASDTTVEADYILENYNHMGWNNVTSINGNGAAYSPWDNAGGYAFTWVSNYYHWAVN